MQLDALGPWDLLTVLGRGGMGVVYRAKHRKTGKIAALKTPNRDARRYRQGLRREIEVLASLSHPGIVEILDHDLNEDPPWYAMSLMEGLSLRDHISRDITTASALSAEFATLPPTALSSPEILVPNVAATVPTPPRTPQEQRALLRLFVHIAEALAHLHNAGLVHCDLKPENIVLQGTNPVLVDFGLASFSRALSGRERLDALLSRGGTLAYMAPEQIAGDTLSPATESLALGATLIECLTGMLPYPIEASTKKPDFGSPRWRAHARDLSDRLLELLSALIDPSPSERPAYAEDVALLLRHELGEDIPCNHSPERLQPPRYVGREDELRTLTGALPPHGNGGLSLVEGASGQGKTRLLLEVAQRARRSAWVIVCRAQASHTHAAPLQTLAPLLERLELEPSALDERELPVLERLVEALHTLAQEHPVVVLLDDLQWADPVTVRWLDVVARREPTERAPWCVFAAWRREERPPALERLVQRDHPHMVLSKLAPRAVRAMACSMLATPHPPEALVEFVVHQSEGQPFFVAEMLRAALSSGRLLRDALTGTWDVAGSLSDIALPQSLLDLITLRLSQAPDATHLLECVAVLGSPAAWDELEALASRDILPAAREATRNALLEFTEDGGLAFVHDKIRETIYHQMPSERRQDMHLRASHLFHADTRAHAEHLKRAGCTNAAHAAFIKLADASSHAELRATFLCEAVDCVPSTPLIERAARALLEAGLMESALAMAERAPERDSVHLLRAEILLEMSQYPEAHLALEHVTAPEHTLRRTVLEAKACFLTARYPEALELCEHVLPELSLSLKETQNERLEAAELAGSVLWRSGRHEDAKRLLKALERRYVVRGNHAGRLRVLLELIPIETARRDAITLGTLEDQTLSLARDIGDLASEGRALDRLGSSYLLRGKHVMALRYYEQAMALEKRLGRPREAFSSAANLALALEELDRFEESIPYFEMAIAQKEKQNDKRALALVTVNYARGLMRSKRWEEARHWLDRAQATAALVGDASLQAWLNEDDFLLEAARGHREKALMLANAAIEYRSETDDSGFYLHSNLTYRGEILLELGRLDEAETDLKVALTFFQSTSNRVSEVITLTYLARVAVRRGEDVSERRAHIETLVEPLDGPRSVFIDIEALDAEIERYSTISSPEGSVSEAASGSKSGEP